MAPGRHAVKDLESLNIHGLKWDDLEASAQSIEQLYEVMHNKAMEAIDWYMEKRRTRKGAAQWLRGLATVFAVLGFMVPVTALAWEALPSELGYVFFVFAGSFLLINRTLGISSGWIRYITTAFALTSLVEEFQIDWARSIAQLEGRIENRDQLNMLLEKLDTFNRRMNQLVERETAGWAAEFEQDLSRLENFVQLRMQQSGTTKPPATGWTDWQP